jgi:hypothetical protein
MTRTSKALKRLGVAGLAAVTIGAGVPALVGAAAQAAGPVTAVTFQSSNSNSGAAGTCLNYTLHAGSGTSNAAGATITVSVSTATPTADITFCTAAQTGFGDGTVANQPAPSAPSRTVASGGAVPTTGGTSTDTAEFTTDANGNVTFGVLSNVPATATISTFVDSNGNGTYDAGELAGPSGTATWTAGGAPGSNQAQAAVSSLQVTPNPDQAVVGETRNYTVTALDTNNKPVPGVRVTYDVFGGETQGPINCPALTDNNGRTTCSIKYTAVSNSTTARFFVNETLANGTSDYQNGEPVKDVAVTVQAVPTGRTISITPSNRNVDYRTASATYTVTVDNPSTAANSGTNSTLVSFTTSGGSSDTTVTPECTTATAASASTTGNASQCVITVSDPSAVAGEVITVTGTIRGTTTRATATMTTTNTPQDARNIVLSPKTQTVTPGSGIGSLTATVTDVNGSPVPNVFVTFTESGPGRFVNQPGSQFTVQTNAAGKATVEVNSTSSESGDETITATIENNNGFNGTTQCTAKAGQDAAGNTVTGAKVGNCSDTAVVTYGSASPSPSSSSPAASSPAGTRQVLVLHINTPTIPAGSRGSITVTGAANQVIDLICYSRPSTTYAVARHTTIDAAGDPVTFSDLALGRNTRCYAAYETNSAQGASPSAVINVTTVVSLSAVRTSVRTYTFQGRNLPRAAGQLITLYRIDNNGNEIRTANLKTDATGIYRLSRHFTGGGTFRFIARTGATLNNIAGHSNVYTVNIH